MCLVKAWTAINRLSIIWKSDLSDKIKPDFFQAAVVSILLTKHIEKKLDGTTQECWTETTQESTPYKTTALRPLTSHL